MNRKKLPKSIYNVAEVKLTYRRKKSKLNNEEITSGFDAHELLLASWDMNRIDLVEQFKILLLDNKNACLGIAEISTGGTDTCPVDPRMVFTMALKANASSIILAHNHPSGSLRHSPSDISLTRQLCEAGKLLHIQVLDHIIVTSDGYSSFACEKLMPT